MLRPVALAAALLTCSFVYSADAQSEDAASRVVSRSALREQAISALVELSLSPDAQIRANAIEGLGRAPARVRDVVARGLRDGNEGVRAVSAVVAGRSDLTELAPAIRPLVDDRSPYVQASAIFALRKLGQTDVDPTPLAGLLLGHPEIGVRAQAAWVLGELGDDSAVGLLRTAVSKPMNRATVGETRVLRLQIAEALYKLGQDGELDTLRAALYPSSPEELEGAALAAQSLGTIDGRIATRELKNLVVYRDEQGGKMPPEVRLAAVRSLGQLGERDGEAYVNEYLDATSPLVRAQVALALGQCDGSDVLSRLAAMMSGAEPEIVRVAAATAALEQTSSRSARGR